MSVSYLAVGGAGGGLAGTVADWATRVMDVLGSPGAGLANALDSIIPVLPSEVILPLAGFAANRGTINLYAALVWTTIGSIVGSVVMYYIGAAFGRDRMMALVARIPLVKVSEVERTEAWFRRHGTKTVFFGRMVPVFRSLISIPAGLERMPLPRFILYTALGSAIWNTIFVMAGYLLGANWPKVEQYGGIFSKVIIGLIVLAVIYFVVSRLMRRRREAAAEESGQTPPGDGPAGGWSDWLPEEDGGAGGWPPREDQRGPVSRPAERHHPTTSAPSGPPAPEPGRHFESPRPTPEPPRGTVYGNPRRQDPPPPARPEPTGWQEPVERPEPPQRPEPPDQPRQFSFWDR